MDIVVVGAGPVGLATAIALGDAGAEVLVLESGGGTRSRADLDRGEVVPAETDPTGARIHAPGHLARIRHRGPGGAAHLWAVRPRPSAPPMLRLVRPEAGDLAARPRLGVPAFPTPLAELDPWLDRAEAVFQIDGVPWRPAEHAPSLPVPRDVLVPRHFAFAPATVITEDLVGRVRAHPSVTLREGATVRRLRLSAQRDAVVGLEVVGDVDSGFEHLGAAQVVLAVGGWQAAHLLMVSDAPDPHDVLGRGVMDHPHGRLGLVTDVDPASLAPFHDFHRAAGHWVLGCYGWADAARRRGDVPGLAAWLVGDRPEVGSEAAAAGSRLVNGRSRGRARLRDVAALVRQPADALRYQLLQLGRRERHGQMVGGWGSPDTALHDIGPMTISVMLEQAPLARNRVELDPSRRDELGLPRMRVRWSWTEVEVDAYWRAVELVCGAMEAAGVGRVRTAEELGSPRVPRLSTGAHRMGGTAMAARAADGVVDLLGRHHQVAGLAIVGGGVLSNSLGHANPTLSMVALGLRTAAAIIGDATGQVREGRDLV